MVSCNHLQRGIEAEQEAYLFLKAQGLTLREKNYRCIAGEIDLIMQDQDDIVFVEVRYRSRDDYGLAIETISVSKQNKLIRAASHFLQKHHLFDKVNSRFDVITVQGKKGSTKLEWVKNAFQ